MKLLLMLVVSLAPSPERQAELLYMLKQDCGSCHGLTLRGGLGPSLLPEALESKPALWLSQTILNGRPRTPMPSWRGLLTETEASWLVENLKQGVP